MFEEEYNKLYAGRYAQNLGEIDANRDVISVTVKLALLNKCNRPKCQL